MDIKGSIFKKKDDLLMVVIGLLSSFYMKCTLLLRGCVVGPGFNAYGNFIIRRRPESIIEIGQGNTFRSIQISNLIGINRKCILATHTKEARIIIGDYCGFSGTVIGSFNQIKIGNHVRCGANTLITDSDWHFDDPRSMKPAPILIEDNVWLGEGSKILKGVTIGKNSVIGAGSIVTRSIPANVIAAGNPCRVIKSII
jgi:acetyltransferase-like isoleucine patch superfamily enzyme